MILRKIRIILSLSLFVTITFCFLDFADVLPDYTINFLTRMQFVPALLSQSWFLLSAILIITLLFGRLYCSVICPFGILQDMVNYIARKINKRKKYGYLPNHRFFRWGSLLATFVAWLTGFTFLFGLVEPYGAYGRIASHLFRPVYFAVNNLLAKIYISQGNYTLYYIDLSIRSISALLVAGLTLVLIVGLSYRLGRFYCNTICPVGTVLGYLSRFSLFKIKINSEKCNHCGACARKCKAFCIDSSLQQIDYTRCINCFDCLDHCKTRAMSYTFRHTILPAPLDSNPSQNKINKNATDESRRNFLSVSLAALIAPTVVSRGTQTIKKVVATAQGCKAYHSSPISPPGSISHANLLSQCVSCHLCITQCPSQVLKPAFMEYGLGGLMQPLVYFDKGFCNFDCNVCSSVCPTGAIAPLTKEKKHLTQTGFVVFIQENCIVQRNGTSCGACAEHCPTQAVSMIPYSGSLTIPSVNPEICVGCGGCEFACPAEPFKAIYVEGIAQHKQAQPFIEKRQKIQQVDDFGF